MRTRRGRNDGQGEIGLYDDDELDDSSSSSEDEEEYNDEESDDEYQTDDEEEDSELIQKKTLLFLCQEGQLRLARQRLRMLREENRLDVLRKEIFQTGPDKNYPLHEVIMGGSMEDSSKHIIPEILQLGKRWKGPFLIMLNAQPPSHGRTALHWAAWCNASMEILRLLTMANPEALLMKDNKRSGSRTPLSIFKRYHHHVAARNNNNDDESSSSSSEKKLAFLESSVKLWSQHRLRLAAYKAVLHWFRKKKDTMPFDKKERKEIGITPKNWFCLSVLGYCLQREMEPLLWNILGFVGGKAQISSKGKSRKRRRSSGI